MRPSEQKVLALAGQHLPSMASIPLLRLGVRYWPIVALTGTALFFKYQERRKNNDATLYNTLADAGAIIAPWATLVALTEFAARKEEKTAAQQLAQSQQIAQAALPQRTAPLSTA